MVYQKFDIKWRLHLSIESVIIYQSAVHWTNKGQSFLKQIAKHIVKICLLLSK